MLFSNKEVAQRINRDFEPVWVSLRPVPLVTIDFGNGKVVKRTLHGNVATYACNSQGEVLDVLPGIYEPKTYTDRLNQLKLLHDYVSDHRMALSNETLREYHERQFEQLKEKKPPMMFEQVRMVSITGAEGPLQTILRPAQRIHARGLYAKRKIKSTKLDSKRLAEWEALAKDTRVNESNRRLAIHQYLMAKEKAIQPKNMAKWIYREVLHADLDDPYLGLGELLFDKYPFTDEDRASSSDSKP